VILLGGQHQAQHAQAEALGVLGGVQGNGVLHGAGHAEIVRGAADREHQRTVGDAALGQDLVVVGGRHDCAHGDGLRRGVEGGHRPEYETEAVVMRQHLVGQTFLVDVQGAGRDFVQRRLPDVVQPAVHQRHLRWPQLAAQFAGQFQAARPATHDHDFATQSKLLHGAPVRQCQYMGDVAILLRRRKACGTLAPVEEAAAAPAARFNGARRAPV